MVKYYQGWYYLQAGDAKAADTRFEEARALPADYCFPHRVEAVLALQAAMSRQPADPRAPYYLGNFWYAHRRYEEAIEAWERAKSLDSSYPTVHRNLGLAYMNKRQDVEQALTLYERAFALDPTDARVFFELDQLHKKIGEDPARRLARLEQHLDLVEQRDDLTIERVTLLNLLGRYEDALRILERRNFHPWEGGEGKTTGQYVASLVQIARQHLQAGRFEQAIDSLEHAQIYPHNLGEGKLAGTQENHIFYNLGCAYEGLGQTDRAAVCFTRASVGLSEPASPRYYNDQPPDMIFYQGLARQKLGQPEAARSIFQKLFDFGQRHINDQIVMDYFAVSLPDFLVFDEDLDRRNNIHCHYMMALGLLGLGDDEDAQQHFAAVLELESHHLGAVIHWSLLQLRKAGGQHA
jgi:tetratricopeptide (TPR) repeat protein